MTDRIIDFSDEPVSLRANNGLLVIERQQPEGCTEPVSDVTVPLGEVAVVVVSQPAVVLTGAVLARLAGAGAVYVACDEKHMPAGMLMPLAGHFVQAERFQRQARASAPMKKRLWQQIVMVKIRGQGRLLTELRGDDRGLAALARRVKSGDTENLEGQASRRYWPALFTGGGFRRDRDEPGENAALNYGYAILRAITARAICAAGLHPSLGVHHHNRYDTFCLADDLMEPFRVIVDEAVVRWAEARGFEGEDLDRETKSAMLEGVGGTFIMAGERRTLFDIIGKAASSLAGVFEGKCEELILPEM